MNIPVDLTSACFAQEEIFIDAPIEIVFETIADINHWPAWQYAVSNASINGITTVGKNFTWKANGLTIHSKLHTVTPFTKIGWTGKMLWIKAIHNWHLIPEGNGTRVDVKESLHGLGSSLMKKTLKEGMRRNLEELKEKVE